MPDSRARWSVAVHDEPDGRCRVEVVDEDGVTFPVARQVTRGQAGILVDRIERESRESGRPVRDVVRDAAFMAATVITVKRLPA